MLDFETPLETTSDTFDAPWIRDRYPHGDDTGVDF